MGRHGGGDLRLTEPERDWLVQTSLEQSSQGLEVRQTKEPPILRDEAPLLLRMRVNGGLAKCKKTSWLGICAQAQIVSNHVL